MQVTGSHKIAIPVTARPIATLNATGRALGWCGLRTPLGREGGGEICGQKHVAVARHCVNEVGIVRVVLEFTAQSVDDALQYFATVFGIIAPDAVDDLLGLQHVATVAH